MLTHGYPEMPTLFTASQVKCMNAERDGYNQLELLPNGLLKHSCCFPKCEMYLKNLATEKDRILNERRGLYHHLRHYWGPSKLYYVRGFHDSAARLAARRIGKSLFKSRMRDEYRRQKLDGQANDDELAMLYDQYCQLYNYK